MISSLLSLTQASRGNMLTLSRRHWKSKALAVTACGTRGEVETARPRGRVEIGVLPVEVGGPGVCADAGAALPCGRGWAAGLGEGRAVARRSAMWLRVCRRWALVLDRRLL